MAVYSTIYYQLAFEKFHSFTFHNDEYFTDTAALFALDISKNKSFTLNTKFWLRGGKKKVEVKLIASSREIWKVVMSRHF